MSPWAWACRSSRQAALTLWPYVRSIPLPTIVAAAAIAGNLMGSL